MEVPYYYLVALVMADQHAPHFEKDTFAQLLGFMPEVKPRAQRKRRRVDFSGWDVRMMLLGRRQVCLCTGRGLDRDLLE